jgi:hypothetical protein
LYYERWQDIEATLIDFSFDDSTAPVIIDMNKAFVDVVGLSSSVNLTDCEPMFHTSHFHWPSGMYTCAASDRQERQERASFQASVAAFARYTTAANVQRCALSFDSTLHHHTYLPKLSEAIGAFMKIDLSSHPEDTKCRFYRLTFGLRDFAIWVKIWTDDAAGGRDFLVDTQQALLEEKARIARVAADGTGPFWKSLQLLLRQRVYSLRRCL